MNFEAVRKFVPRLTKKKEHTLDIPPMRPAPEVTPMVEIPTGGEVVLFERPGLKKALDVLPVVTKTLDIPTQRPAEQVRPARQTESATVVSPWHDTLRERVIKKEQTGRQAILSNAPAFEPPTYKTISQQEATTALTKLEKTVTSLKQKETPYALAA